MTRGPRACAKASSGVAALRAGRGQRAVPDHRGRRREARPIPADLDRRGRRDRQAGQRQRACAPRQRPRRCYRGRRWTRRCRGRYQPAAPRAWRRPRPRRHVRLRQAGLRLSPGCVGYPCHRRQETGSASTTACASPSGFCSPIACPVFGTTFHPTPIAARSRCSSAPDRWPHPGDTSVESRACATRSERTGWYQRPTTRPRDGLPEAQ